VTTRKEGTPVSAQFAMDSTLDAFSEEDLVLIDESIMAAYNETFPVRHHQFNVTRHPEE
jgi:hypothetical protein